MIEGHDLVDPTIRQLDQSRIGAVLCGEAEALFGGPPVTAMLIQNTNPMSVAPEQAKVKRGFARDDLFVCVHEQVMTETAAMADIVLPATMFLEHDDIYRGGGHQYIILGPKLVEPPGECRTNHQVIAGLAARLGFDHPGFAMSEREHIDWMLRNSEPRHARRARGSKRWIDCQPDFRAVALSRRLRPSGRQVPLQAGLAEGRRAEQRADGTVGDDAVAARLLAGDRGGRRDAIRSASPPRRRAPSSTRPSTRRRRRGRRRAAGPRC